MPRSDRLFDLIQLLRDGRLHRASDLGQAMGVSVRTIWRDMAVLAASGLGVEGERGVGYILRAPITLPPMLLQASEMLALRAGLKAVAEGGGDLAEAARSLAGKLSLVAPGPKDQGEDIFATRPETGRGDPGREGQDGLGGGGAGRGNAGGGNAGGGGGAGGGAGRGDTGRGGPQLPLIRKAVRQHEALTVAVLEEGRLVERDIRPLALLLEGTWVLAAWVEGLGFAAFGLDRVLDVVPRGQAFPRETGRRLADWRRWREGGAEPGALAQGLAASAPSSRA